VKRASWFRQAWTRPSLLGSILRYKIRQNQVQKPGGCRDRKRDRGIGENHERDLSVAPHRVT
jgi:hypothetical protein